MMCVSCQSSSQTLALVKPFSLKGSPSAFHYTFRHLTCNQITPWPSSEVNSWNLGVKEGPLTCSLAVLLGMLWAHCSASTSFHSCGYENWTCSYAGFSYPSAHLFLFVWVFVVFVLVLVFCLVLVGFFCFVWFGFFLVFFFSYCLLLV